MDKISCLANCLLCFYIFSVQGNGMRDFKVGEELRVQCSSFSGKGIPVMSLLDDML